MMTRTVFCYSCWRRCRGGNCESASATSFAEYEAGAGATDLGEVWGKTWLPDGSPLEKSLRSPARRPPRVESRRSSRHLRDGSAIPNVSMCPVSRPNHARTVSARSSAPLAGRRRASSFPLNKTMEPVSGAPHSSQRHGSTVHSTKISSGAGGSTIQTPSLELALAPRARAVRWI
jgi:hypothetical protein